VAFDWIESHRGLRDHPKTVTLAATWGDRKTCVIGHLHELWWWTLEYAPAGVIRPEFYPQVVQACEWHGRAEKFWSGLVESGFLDLQMDGSYVVHDWDEYALRRIQRHDKDNERKEKWRAGRAGKTGPDAPVGRPKSQNATSGATSPYARTLPDHTGATPLTGPTPTPSPPDAPTADAQGAPPTASAGADVVAQSQPPPPRWKEVAPGLHRGTPNGVGEVSLLTARCPRCERSMPVAEIEDHPCELVVGEPVQAPPKRRGGRGLHRVFEATAVPPEVEEELARMAANRPTAEQIAAEVERLGRDRQ
jgi:hypothetical protein